MTLEILNVHVKSRQVLLHVCFQVSLHEVSRTSPHDGGIGASFLLGHAGIYAVSALVFNALGMYMYELNTL